MSIYVEIFIRDNMDDLWQKTQEPKLHGRRDLRFCRSTLYLVRPEQLRSSCIRPASARACRSAEKAVRAEQVPFE